MGLTMLLPLLAVAAGLCSGVPVQEVPLDSNGGNGSDTYTFGIFGDRTKCLGELGCFEITSEWRHLIKRPINLLPDDRNVINTRFFLYTRKNPKVAQELFSDSKSVIIRSNFNPDAGTKIIVHGWLDALSHTEILDRFTAALLENDDFNVIVVNWKGGSKKLYSQAVANARVVGAEIALLIQKLMNWMETGPEKFHLIGHSVGGHIVGYAGKRIKNLGRITSLDPSEPYFQDMPPVVRVDKTDANFVDVIHTDARSILLLGFGMSQAVGHVDFYPNGGSSHPGCGLTDRVSSIFTDGLKLGLHKFTSCYHKRAVDFFIDSINRAYCLPVAYACGSFEMFTLGKCTDCFWDNSRCSIMGFYADAIKPKIPGLKYYLKTHGESPFCMHHYQVAVTMERNSWFQEEKGQLYLILKGDRGKESFTLTKGNMKLYKGSQYTFLVTVGRNLGNIQSLDFKWKSNAWFRKPSIYLTDIVITPMNIIDRALKRANTKSFCYNYGIVTNKEVTFHSCNKVD